VRDDRSLVAPEPSSASEREGDDRLRNSERLLVTGGSGFLGSEIVRQAAVAGVPTRVLVRRRGSAPAGVDEAIGDVLDPASLRDSLAGCERVIHAAGLAHGRARRSRELERTNVQGTENVLRAAAGAGASRFLLVSSVSVYGEGSRSPRDEDTGCRPVGPYASSKRAAELRAIELSRELGLDLVVLRLATLYGEDDPGNVGRLIRAVDRGRFVLLGSGGNSKSLLHREDAARACLEAARRASTGAHVYNVVGSVAPIEEVVEIVARRLGRRWLRLPVPEPLLSRLVAGAERLAGNGPLARSLRAFFRDDVYDGRRFEATFGFQPRIPLEEGLQREVDWYRGFA
jgi:dihydroflavonol-4-reductase